MILGVEPMFSTTRATARSLFNEALQSCFLIGQRTVRKIMRPRDNENAFRSSISSSAIVSRILRFLFFIMRTSSCGATSVTYRPVFALAISTIFLMMMASMLHCLRRIYRQTTRSLAFRREEATKMACN